MKGGYRSGSGRPMGSKDKKPRKLRPKAQAATPETVESSKKCRPRTKDVIQAPTPQPEGKKLPLEYIMDVINDPAAHEDRKDRLAVAALPFAHPKIGEKDKKQERDEKAKAAGAGRFAPSAPPRLAVVNK